MKCLAFSPKKHPNVNVYTPFSALEYLAITIGSPLTKGPVVHSYNQHFSFLQ
jgi:hypothetical protein